MQTKRLRWLIQHYGNLGILLVAAYLLGCHVKATKRHWGWLLRLSFVLVLWLPFWHKTQIAALHPLPASNALRRDVAGVYFCGNGFSSKRLELRPDATFTYQSAGCMGIYVQATGHFTLGPEEIVPRGVRFQKRTSGEALPQRWICVRWDHYKYLLAPEQILGFCRRVREGWRPKIRGREPYLHCGLVPTRKHLPSVPRLYQTYLFKLFQTQVLRVLTAHSILINQGRRAGLVPGTMVASSATEDTDSNAWYTVTEVWGESALCERCYTDSPAPIKPKTPLQIIPQ